MAQTLIDSEQGLLRDIEFNLTEVLHPHALNPLLTPLYQVINARYANEGAHQPHKWTLDPQRRLRQRVILGSKQLTLSAASPVLRERLDHQDLLTLTSAHRTHSDPDMVGSHSVGRHGGGKHLRLNFVPGPHEKSGLGFNITVDSEGNSSDDLTSKDPRHNVAALSFWGRVGRRYMEPVGAMVSVRAGNALMGDPQVDMTELTLGYKKDYWVISEPPKRKPTVPFTLKPYELRTTQGYINLPRPVRIGTEFMATNFDQPLGNLVIGLFPELENLVNFPGP